MRKFWLAAAVLVWGGVAGAMEQAAAPALKIPATTIRHRFLAEDESRSQLLLVDQADPAKNLTIGFPERYRDFQLIGGERVLLSTGDGYAEYSLKTKALLKQVKGFPGATFARRTADGRTIVGGNAGGIVIRELDATDQELRKAVFAFNQVRLGRLTPQGTVLFGSDAKLVEGTLDGKVVKEFAIEGCKHLYHAVRAPDGHLLATTGYGASWVELDADGKLLKRFGGLQAPEAQDLGYHFYSGFQVLKNGHVVCCNWTGHGAKDSVKGVQLVEFDAAGRVVWTWHDPEHAGSIHGVIVLDDLDTGVLNDDVSSVLGPVAAK